MVVRNAGERMIEVTEFIGYCPFLSKFLSLALFLFFHLFFCFVSDEQEWGSIVMVDNK
jgi:hypothetical protein